jgi:protein toll
VLHSDERSCICHIFYRLDLPNRTRFIDLSGNKLTSISFITSLQENATVDLANNPFACDSCSDFVLLWAAYSNKIKSGENTTCIKKSANELEPSEHVTIQDIVSLAEDCKPVLTGEIRTLIIVVAVLAVFCVLLIIVVFRYAWVIKAYLYSKGLGWCLFWDRDFDAEDEEKLYDAFVSYSHKVQ